MLCLRRRLDEAIRIGDEVTVKVLQIEGNQVLLGVEAPRDVRVLRTELLRGDDRAPAEPGP